MENLTMNDFRRQVGEYINQTYYAGKAFTLKKGDRSVAALVPMATLKRLAELEDFYAQTLADKENAELSNSENTASREVATE